MTATHFGACLCGAVKFEVNGDFEHFFLCHCEYCRKDTGSAHAANLFSSAAELKWLAGKDLGRQFRLPGTRHVRSFCSVCGSALPHLQSVGNQKPNDQKDGTLLVVPAGSLDSSLSMKPNAHLFVSSRANWDDRLENIPKFDRLPGSDHDSRHREP